MIDGKHCEYNVPQTKLFPPLASDSLPSPASQQVATGLDASEQRALLYFRERTTNDLTGFTSYTHTFWNSLIPGLCQSDDAIRHIIVALATKHEALHSDSDRAGEINPLCMKHHTMALQTLTQPSLVRNEEILLVSCIAFITFERLTDPGGTSGHYLDYIIAGLKILSERERTRTKVEDTAAAFNLIDHFIEPMFFQIQLVMSMFCEPARLVWNAAPPANQTAPNIPRNFSSFQSAREALFQICVWRYVLTHRGEAWSSTSAGFLEVKTLLSKWHQSLNMLADSLPSDVPEERRRFDALKLQGQIQVGAILYSVRDDAPSGFMNRPALVYLSMPSKIAIFTRISNSRKINLSGINGRLSSTPHAKRVGGPDGENFIVMELSTTGSIVRD